MITILYEPFSEKRREVRRCWEYQHDFIPDWYDYLYLMTGRAERSDGELIDINKMEVGTIFEYGKYIFEKSQSDKLACLKCFGQRAKNYCRNLPDCNSDKFYYRKLNSFEIRRLYKSLKKKKK